MHPVSRPADCLCDNNTVRLCRNENETNYIAKFDGTSQNNIIETLYGLGLPSGLGNSAGNNLIKTAQTETVSNAVLLKRWDFDKNKCFNVGVRGESGSSTIIDGVDCVKYDNVRPGNIPTDNAVTILDDGLNIGGYSCIGYMIDTHYVKRFLISASDNARPLIVPMNENKIAIEENPIYQTYASIWKVSDGSICYTASPLENGESIQLTVTDNTKFVFIGFQDKVKSFSIFSIISGTRVFGQIPNVIRLTSDIGSRKIPNATITSKCDTGTMLPACDPTGTALAYICIDGAAQTWTAINKPT